jgi:hypothetical protein
MDDEKKAGRPSFIEVYCITASVLTSKGRIHHGDRIKLPPDEAQALRKRNLVQ